MSEGSSHTPATSSQLDEAKASCPGGDIVGISAPSIHFRSSEHGSTLSGNTEGNASVSRSGEEQAGKATPSCAARSAIGASQIDLSMSEDLEITPHFEEQRADTLPEWMLSNPAPVVPAAQDPAYLAESKPASRGVWVALLGVVAAGTWWFAADGVKLMNETTSGPPPVVVAAAPAISVSPEAPAAAPAPEAKPEPILSPVPVEAKAEPKAKPAKVQAPRRKARKKKHRQAPKPIALAKRPALSKVSGLSLGQAGAGRSCRSLGSTVSASDHERVNLCFKIQPAAGESSVVVQWRHNGAVVRSTEHDLPSSGKLTSIRAFSRVQSAQSGKWTVQVRTAAGKVLASKNFTVSL